MAVHPDLKSLVREAVPEYLHVAKYCVKFRKDSGGCLGYPAAVMLFSIADTIGSLYRGTDLSINVGGRAVRIHRDGFQHLFILNSEFYEQKLDEQTIKRLYNNFRSLLVHNASLAPNHFLLNEPMESAPFPIRHGKCCVNVHGFLGISQRAAKLFLSRVDQVVPKSQQAANIGQKR